MQFSFIRGRMILDRLGLLWFVVFNFKTPQTAKCVPAWTVNSKRIRSPKLWFVCPVPHNIIFYLVYNFFRVKMKASPSWHKIEHCLYLLISLIFSLFLMFWDNWLHNLLIIYIYIYLFKFLSTFTIPSIDIYM